MWPKRALLAVPAAALALASAYDAALLHYAATPAGAPGVLQGELRLQFTSPDNALHGASGQADLARSMLRHRPLTPAAVRQLALEQQSTARAAAGLVLAERMSRRDLATEASLFDRAAAEAEPGRLAIHLDRMVSVHPEAGKVAYPPLARALGDLRIQAALAPMAQRPWFQGFLAAAAGTADGHALAALVSASQMRFTAADGPLLAQLLRAIAAAGDHAAARKLAIQAGGARASDLDTFDFTAGSTRSAYAPLTWTLASNGDVQAEVQPGGGLAVELVPDRQLPVAERTTVLAPGPYRLEQTVAGAAQSDASAFAWQMRCGTDGAIAWRQSVPVRAATIHYRSALVVPAGCLSQHWQLTAAIGTGQTAGSLQIGGLRLYRGP